MLAGGVDEIFGRERHGRGVEDAAGDTDEGNDQEELKRVDGVIAQLRGGHVEAEEKGCGEADDRGGAEDGADADEEADGDAPG